METTYKQLRKATPLICLTRWNISEHICLLLSPLFSVPFIKHRIKPNTITMMMIILGFIGGILFALPWLICKIIAVLVYWLWFILDFSDGEVARYTKTFSKYGKQLDWMAHLICHPLIITATWISFRQAGVPYLDVLSVLSLLFISCELIRRNQIAFDTFLSVNTEMGIQSRSQTLPLHNWLLAQIMYFPNFVFFFPILYVISFSLHWEDIVYIYIIWASLNCLYVIRDIIRYTLFLYRS